jgi:hypothetical protein
MLCTVMQAEGMRLQRRVSSRCEQTQSGLALEEPDTHRHQATALCSPDVTLENTDHAVYSRASRGDATATTVKQQV